MAHKKAAGSTRLGRDSAGQRLGVKVFGDQIVQAGGIILKQRGTPFAPGANVGRGKDDSLYSLITGKVRFQSFMRRKFTGSLKRTRVVSVMPVEVQGA